MTNVPMRLCGLESVTAVAAGAMHALAVKSDGTVWAWGYNAYGQLGSATPAESPAALQVSGISPAGALAAGTFHSLAAAKTTKKPDNNGATISDLIEAVQSLSLPDGISKSLLAKLTGAQEAMDQGRQDAACGKLGAFVNEVQAQSGKKIPAAGADQLLQLAGELRASLSCS